MISVTKIPDKAEKKLEIFLILKKYTRDINDIIKIT